MMHDAFGARCKQTSTVIVFFPRTCHGGSATTSRAPGQKCIGAAAKTPVKLKIEYVEL
ncbi:hypothetical protein PVAP13_9NG316473 [Panicum virgatum]|uniref:Uncharacterized protein n=1 Tax=Panicum virgatum TaxID=38727 RepID=A0A8T0ML47_PANVG|nr:hypothetical protein PVAP13_9NG316473 [Panicum virgatum]